MKTPDHLVSIWLLNTPPNVPDENDYLLMIDMINSNGKPVHQYVAVQWCPYDKNYFAEPVNVDQTGKLTKTEMVFEEQGLQIFTAKMNQLGIQDLRGFVINSERKDLQKQLADIHPSLAPLIVK